jgi:type VI secretion system protein VasG
MEDGEGRQIDFRNTIILLTSNTGSDIISSACADPETMPGEESLLKVIQPALLKVFPAAFLGRVTVIPYLPLATSSLQRIVNIHLNRIAERAKANYDLELSFSEELVQHVVEQCPVAETGARMLIRFIEKNILPKVGVAILNSTGAAATQNKNVAMRVAYSHEKGIELIHQTEELPTT